ncbi:MAG TPA: hypothetical protein HA364_04680 [Thermoplasmata archaeon]|nr:hypothetical protein [Thermoplasmata archaeon]
MALLKSAKEHWFSVTLYALFSAFFLVAGVLSASTYVSVVSTQNKVLLENASFSADELENGSVEITFSIDLVNPSRYDLKMQSIVWEAFVTNGTSGTGWYIPVGSAYTGPTSYVEVPSGDTMTFSYSSLVSDPETLAKLNGLVNYSALEGEHLTLETLPYIHEFYTVAWMGDFKHDYLREMYLNEIVKVQLEYSSEAVT